MEPTTDISKRSFRIAGALILLLALALRIMGARGDLAQDEITSLGLVSHVTRFDEIFWKINYDNSHPLNSAWLYLVGPGASFMTMRAFSIALGIGTVWAAGVWGARRSYFTGLIAMLLMATSYLMVNYGSEARGYSGLSLCIILAALFLEDIMNGKKRYAALTVSVFFGTLFHFDMVLAIAVLAMTCFWLEAEQVGLVKAMDKTLMIFLLPGIAVAAVILPEILIGYTFNFIKPFNVREFLGADNLALETGLNIAPDLKLHYIDLIIAVTASLLWFKRHRGDMRTMFFVVSLIGLPVALWAVRVPNTDVPRHFILCGIVYILFAATIIDAAIRRNNSLRVAAGIGIIVILIGNSILLSKFFGNERGSYSAAVAHMAAQGPITYGINNKAMPEMLDFYATRLHVDAPQYVPTDSWCDKGPPERLIVAFVASQDATPAEQIDWGPPGCQTHYQREVIYPVWGLTGAGWALFDRQ